MTLWLRENLARDRIALGCALLLSLAAVIAAGMYATGPGASAGSVPATDVEGSSQANLVLPERGSIGGPEAFRAAPLFIKSRAPTPREASAPVLQSDTPRTSPDPILYGIVVDDGRRRALLGVGGEAQSQLVSIGEAFEGWTVGEITPESVTIKSGPRTLKLILADKTREARPAPSASSKFVIGPE